jgi:hypothetical protein
VTYLLPPLEDAAPRPPPVDPMIEDISRLQGIVGLAGRLADLSARLAYAQPPHLWSDFTDVFREQAWRARLTALREERAAIVKFDGGLAWMEVTGKSEGAAP